MFFKTLTPPKTPEEAIESRRNPCYGFTIIADISEYKELMEKFADTRDKIIQIFDPDRSLKNYYVKQTDFHAAVFGMTPLLEKKPFMDVYAHPNGLLNKAVVDNMCNIMQKHIQNERPVLRPVSCELMPDGTILARFKYLTVTEDEAPLLTLASNLDPNKVFSTWDAGNKVRYSTVTVALCVIDTNVMSAEKLAAINEQIALASKALKTLGDLSLSRFYFINFYNKRTLSLSHVEMSESIEEGFICKA